MTARHRAAHTQPQTASGLDFFGCTEVLLLHDLVTDPLSAVDFCLPFDDFQLSAVPLDVSSSRLYRELSKRFIQRRNGRIEALTVRTHNSVPRVAAPAWSVLPPFVPGRVLPDLRPRSRGGGSEHHAPYS